MHTLVGWPAATCYSAPPTCGRTRLRIEFRNKPIFSPWRSLVRELVRYLLENAVIDFRGEISMEKVREALREDDSREARSLLSKLIDDKGVDDLLITIADCLKDHIRVGITEDTLREQLTMYSESYRSGSAVGRGGRVI